MGSMIHLAVGRLEIDWGKNDGFNDHSSLFQTNDVKDVPYYYAKDINSGIDGSWEIITEYKEGLSKPLYQVIDRINLLGHTLNYTEKEFLYLSKLNSSDTASFSYGQLTEVLTKVDFTTLSADYGLGGVDIENFLIREIFPRLHFEGIVEDPNYLENDCSLAMENLSPYSILNLLSANQSAKHLTVDWAFSDLVENGWANINYFIRPLDRKNKFLIVTEGSSDSTILKKAFALLKPHVADFFDFVDMQEGYPFSGTGNLVNFVKGLISISIQNDIIVLFDNDAAGVYSFNQCLRLNIPPNMQILKLPDQTDFESFETIGPNGNHKADINGRGASIECYLDLNELGCVRWNNYNPNLKLYQGELIEKDKYKRDFLNHSELTLGYDYSKLLAVLDMIIANSISMRESVLVSSLEKEMEQF